MNPLAPIPLKEEEEVLLLVHQSVIPRLPRFIGFALLLCIPFFFAFPLFRQGGLGVLGFFILLIPPAVLLLREYRGWTDTVLVVTDRRVVDVERRGLFDKEVCEADYAEIDEVTFRVKGFAPTVFRYGAIEIKTSGNAADIEFPRAPRPADVHEIIADARRSVLERPVSRTERRLRTLAKRVKPEELDQLERRARTRDQEEALEAVFGEE